MLMFTQDWSGDKWLWFWILMANSLYLAANTDGCTIMLIVLLNYPLVQHINGMAVNAFMHITTGGIYYTSTGKW